MKKIVIVVSGPPGAGSTTIAKMLAKKLKIKFFSPGLIQKRLIRGKNQTRAAFETWKMKLVRTKGFHENMDKMQINIAKEGNIVICGKLSIHFLKKIANYRIWLDVSLNERARRAASRDRISFKEAKELIAKRQRTERKEFKRIYGFDYLKQKEDADLVLDSTGLSPEQTTEKIIKLIKRKI